VGDRGRVRSVPLPARLDRIGLAELAELAELVEESHRIANAKTRRR
jgi:hypothetical protein